MNTEKTLDILQTGIRLQKESEAFSTLLELIGDLGLEMVSIHRED